LIFIILDIISLEKTKPVGESPIQALKTQYNKLAQLKPNAFISKDITIKKKAKGFGAYLPVERAFNFHYFSLTILPFQIIILPQHLYAKLIIAEKQHLEIIDDNDIRY
jgi:hypothetical protein